MLSLTMSDSITNDLYSFDMKIQEVEDLKVKDYSECSVKFLKKVRITAFNEILDFGHMRNFFRGKILKKTHFRRFFFQISLERTNKTRQ